MMDNCCAPQWADFIHSPKVPCENYFDITHEVHEPQTYLESCSQLNVPFLYNKESINEQSMSETKFDDSLESETSIYNNVAYFTPCDKKENIIKKVKEDSLSKAMKNLKLDEKCNKNSAWDISVSELISDFKDSKVDRKIKPGVPEKFKNPFRALKTKKPVLTKSSVTKFQGHDIKKNNRQSSFEKNSNELALKLNNSSTDLSEKERPYKVVSHPRNQTTKKYSSGKSQPKVLTCQYRRQSLVKYRRPLNQYVSLAEAVSKFQNRTPQRFRTMSSKDMKPDLLMKMKKSPMKLTCPLSPALRCMQRTRQATIVNQQECERLKVEEMKKHQVKASPIPVSILKAPSVPIKVVKKPTTVIEEFHLTQPKKTHGSAHTSMQQNHSNKEQKINESIKKKCTESAALSIMPKSLNLEDRNKESQTKKKMKLKTLHDPETNKVKVEFHARPAPQFLKVSNPLKEQTNKKKVTLPRPFSFEERNKCLAKKKHEHIKQIQEKDISHIFHTNPAPNFKQNIVNSTLKEKDEPTNCYKVVRKEDKSYIDQENKQPDIIDNNILSADTTKENSKDHVTSNKTNIKQGNKILNNDKSDKFLSSQTTKFELKTDKRAKEREKFDEKMRKREHELEMKKQEEEESRLLKEKIERAELRKIAEVKARPIPIYKPVIVQKSTKPPTSPRSPAWAGRPKPKRVL